MCVICEFGIDLDKYDKNKLNDEKTKVNEEQKYIR